MRSAVRRQMGRIVTAVGLVLWVTAPARGDVIVVPQSLAMVEGNSNNVFPFEPLGTTMRYQQVYSATEFSQPMLITGLLFRLDGQFQHPLSRTIANIRFDLSTTAFGPDMLQDLFASNVGLDNQTVFSGQLHVSSAGTGKPSNFDIAVPFTTPFFFNPVAGHLLVDVRNFSPEQATGLILDATDRAGDPVSRIFSRDVNAASGFRDSLGLVTAFEATTAAPTPEPASAILMLTGIAAAMLRRRRRDAARLPPC